MPTPCWLKHLCSIRALVPVSCFLSLSLSPPLSFSGWSPGAQRLSEITPLLGLLRPSREGALHLHPIEGVSGAFVNSTNPVPGALLVFCVNQGLSASFSLLYFLIIDSGPPGSSPLKDLNTREVIWAESNWIQIEKKKNQIHTENKTQWQR